MCVELPVMDDGAESTSEMALALVFDEDMTSVIYADGEAAKKSKQKNGRVETFSLMEALDGEVDFIAERENGGDIFGWVRRRGNWRSYKADEKDKPFESDCFSECGMDARRRWRRYL